MKQRSRACNAGYGQCGSESPYERVSCNEQACDEFGSWSNWSKCTEQCGGGYTSRSRDCDSGDCTGMGSSFQTGRCNTQPCGKSSTNSILDGSKSSISKIDMSHEIPIWIALCFTI